MITSNLRINQLSPEGYARYLRMLDALDAKDVEGYGADFAEAVVMRFGNGPAVEGRAAVFEMLRRSWQGFASIEHDLRNIYGDDRAFVLEASNHYVRLDGGRVTVEAVAFTDFGADDRVSSVRIYGDVSPVFAPAS